MQDETMLTKRAEQIKRARAAYAELERSGGLEEYRGQIVVCRFNQSGMFEVVDSGPYHEWIDVMRRVLKKYGDCAINDSYIHRAGDPLSPDNQVATCSVFVHR